VFGQCPFLYGLFVAGNRIKMIGAFEMSITVFNALSRVFEYEPINVLNDGNPFSSSTSMLRENICLLKALQTCCKQFQFNSHNSRSIITLVENLWENQYLPFVLTHNQQHYLQEELTIQDDNYEEVLLHMCIQMCWYNRIALKHTNALVKDKNQQLNDFTKWHLPNAIAKAELKERLLGDFQGVDLNKNHYPSKILVTANLHSPNDVMTKGLGVITSEEEMIKMAKLSSYLMQTAMHCMLREVQVDIDKQNANINNDDEKLQILVGKQVMNPGQYSKYRQYTGKELSRDDRSVVEQVNVNIAIEFYQDCKANSFIVKSFYKGNALSASCYDAEVTVYNKASNIDGFPKLFHKDIDTLSIIIENVGESCKNHKFSISELIQVCKIVDKLHKLGMVHNDLKESNLTIRKQQASSQIFLIDYESVNNNAGVPNIHTKGYKAPERLVDKKRSYYASDIYSLGIIFANQVCNRFIHKCCY